MLSLIEIAKLKKRLAQTDDQLPLLFNALGDSSRFRILWLLSRHHDICVSDVARILGISVPAASQQLRILELAGLVVRERHGQMVCYELKRKNPLLRPLLTFFTL